MTDRELLELAAKAARYVGEWKFLDAFNGRTQGWHFVLADGSIFSPLTDDGDALRLAVKLGISVTPYPIYQPERHSVIAKQRRISDTLRENNPTETLELYGNDPYAATRRAIVRAAAEIGKEMK